MNNDPGAWARAYMGLGWPVALGHRYRPRQGCTCNDPTCERPGAHPGPGGPQYLTEHELDEHLEKAPAPSLIVPMADFDAVTVERYAGTYVMVHLESSAPVPCVMTHETATFLVRQGTGAMAKTHPAVHVTAGARGWLALPPSHGTYWDTPPWDEATGEPRDFVDGERVGAVLTGMRTWLDGTERVGAVR